MQAIGILPETPLSTGTPSDAVQELTVSTVDDQGNNALSAAGTERDEPAKLPADKADPAIRLDRIKAIRNALADGSYSVSASDVAEKLMTHLLQK